MNFDQKFEQACELDGVETQYPIENIRFIANILRDFPRAYPNIWKELCDRGEEKNIRLAECVALIDRHSE